MRQTQSMAILIAGAALLARPAAAATEPKTEQAVIATDRAWGDAEVQGDVAFLADLLMPGYRSVGADGKILTGEAIIESARKRRYSESRAAQVKAWRAAHPTVADVRIVGDTAILIWTIQKPQAPERISSSDIFIYDHARWRAIYSQHSTAAN